MSNPEYCFFKSTLSSLTSNHSRSIVIVKRYSVTASSFVYVYGASFTRTILPLKMESAGPPIQGEEYSPL